MKKLKKLKRSQKISLSIVAVIIFLVAGVMIFLNLKTYRASPAAMTAVSQTNVEVQANWLEFKATSPEKKIKLIFYQGALVEAESYSLWAQELAAAGYHVYLLKSPGSLAILKMNLAEKVLAQKPEMEFVLGGHSLGGVVASRFAQQNSSNPKLKGVLFLASYPDQKGSLAETDLAVLSLRGTEDGVLNEARYEEARQYLPTQTIFKDIQGGNHAGFGSYGPQKGDTQATITNAEQQTEIAKDLIKWLAALE